MALSLSVTSTKIKPTAVPCLKTQLKLWQAIGKEKLKTLARSDFGGGFLSAAVGLGKSPTALVAAMELQMLKPPMARGFNLIVCRPGKRAIRSSFSTWLRDPGFRSFKYDFVICTGNFLKQRYHDLKTYQHYHDLLLHDPLHLAVDDVWEQNIEVLILDEYHDAKNEESQYNIAVHLCTAITPSY
ncbi:hypothetical protein G7Z17_g11400 [Cylindrodendrum hubeiense]|uniref:Helicase ATP-binding domain-containing protein n=1 Tax=Cylindrodendrum hubeiense TaxID=595255 RepID=A0A9P5GZM3_9HYPO|nr:hypothetical protein G7Z17_g11400 [Cylindrodendrum hubeiense]